MTRGPDKQFDPEIALDKAMQLFWAKGYAATGLNELLETMEIGRKSLYDTFGNKRALYIKALHRYSQTVVGEIHRGLNNPDRPALENVRAVMRDIAATNGEPMSPGCLLGVSSLLQGLRESPSGRRPEADDQCAEPRAALYERPPGLDPDRPRDGDARAAARHRGRRACRSRERVVFFDET
jgi:AcrR family transcriptional regulator